MGTRFTSRSNIWDPLISCQAIVAPAHYRYLWTAIAGIVTAIFSFYEAWDSRDKGERYVPRSGRVNTLVAFSNTTVAGISGYLADDGCSSYKAANIMKEIMLVGVNRLAFEKADILTMLLSLAGPIYIPLIAGVQLGWWFLLDPAAVSILVFSVGYIWLWAGTAKKRSLSAGTIGGATALILLRLAMIASACYSFVETPGTSSTSVQTFFQILPSVGMIPEGLFQYLRWKFAQRRG